MRTEFERAYVTAHGSAAVLALNHPEVVNAISAPMIEGLAEGATDIPSSITVRMDRGHHPLLLRLRDFPEPIVTAVNGAAVGIGMSLALMGDLVTAGHTAMPAEKLTAEQALDWGLVNRVFDDAAMRRMYWQSPHNTYEQQLEVERENQLRAGATQDFIEGVGAFLEKRKPVYRGQ